MNEYIKKEDAIRIAMAYIPDDDGSCSKADRDPREMLDEIENWPAEDNVREITRAHWEHVGGDEWCCSGCGNVVHTEGSWENPLDVGDYFCHNCGADMR